jgi:phosphoenolpyruvate carboxylase
LNLSSEKLVSKFGFSKCNEYRYAKETTGSDFFNSLSAVYNLSEKFHVSQDSGDFEALAAKLSSLSNEETVMLASAFSNVLNLHNVSEHVAAAMEERHARLDGRGSSVAHNRPRVYTTSELL